MSDGFPPFAHDNLFGSKGSSKRHARVFGDSELGIHLCRLILSEPKQNKKLCDI